MRKILPAGMRLEFEPKQISSLWLSAVLFLCLVARPTQVHAVNVACVGDSITYGYTIPSQSYPTQLQALFNARDGAGAYSVGNFGISARTLRDDGDRPYTAENIYAASLASNPDVVVIMLGANDAKVGVNWNVAAKDGTNTSINIYNDDYAALIESYRTLPSAPKILICSLVPVRTVGSGTDYGISATVIDNEMCPSIRTTLSAPADVGMIELNAIFPHDNTAYYISDLIHPSATGYAFIADKIYNAIRTTFDPDWNTFPLDGDPYVEEPSISWSPNPEAVEYNVYFGTNESAVASATSASPEYRQTTTSLSYATGMDSQSDYFWRIDTVTVLTTNQGPVRSFTTGLLSGSGRSISFNFRNASDEGFAGGQLIGPLATDSATWNAGTGASGVLAGLIDDHGTATGASIQWATDHTWVNGDGIADDEHRLSTGYLDDNLGGYPIVTVSNIPYTAYTVYGLFASDQAQPCGMVNYQVNGTWTLGGSAVTVASAWGTIDENLADHGENWTKVVSGSVQGNYWSVETTGSVCHIEGQSKNGGNRGCLTGLIIEELPDTDGDGIPNRDDSDDDGDGMPDRWEATHALNPLMNDGAGNPDSDAYDNHAEYVADTDPQDGYSWQSFSMEMDAGTAERMLHFSTSSNRQYAVEYSNDLVSGNWQPLEPAAEGTGSERTITDATTSSNRYYRLWLAVP